MFSDLVVDCRSLFFIFNTYITLFEFPVHDFNIISLCSNCMLSMQSMVSLCQDILLCVITIFVHTASSHK